MKMLYRRDGEFIEYRVATDPVEAINWSTHRLKKGEIFLKVKLDKKLSTKIRQEIFDDILSREPNPTKKPAPADNKIPKERKSSKRQHAKTRKTKRKAG